MAREKMNITFENLFENFQTTMNSESEQGKQPRKKNQFVVTNLKQVYSTKNVTLDCYEACWLDKPRLNYFPPRCGAIVIYF